MKQFASALISFFIILFVTFPEYPYVNGLYVNKKPSNVTYFSSPQFYDLMFSLKHYTLDKELKFYNINQQLRFSLFAKNHADLDQLNTEVRELLKSRIRISIKEFNESLKIADTKNTVSKETQIILDAIKKSKLSTNARKITPQDVFDDVIEVSGNFKSLNFNVFVSILISLILSACLFFLFLPTKEND